MKKILIIFLMLFSACSNKGGSGPSDNPVSAVSSSCAFSSLTSIQIQSIHRTLSDIIEQKYSGHMCDLNHIYQDLSMSLVFEILKYKGNIDILKAIENNNLAGFISSVFDDRSCQMISIDSNRVNNIKQCKWER